MDYLVISALIFFVLIVSIVIYDKIVGRKKRQRQVLPSVPGRGTENCRGTMLRQVIAGLEELPEDAYFTQIKASLDRAALRAVPEVVRRRALEVFGDEDKAGEWLTTQIVALGGQAPMDTLMRAEGEEEVFKVLGRIEHGVFS